MPGKTQLRAEARVARAFDTGGCDVDVVVTNGGTRAVLDWEVDLEVPVGVTWASPNVTWAPKTTTLTLRPEPWAKALPPGASATMTVGLKAVGTTPARATARQLVPVPPDDASLARRTQAGEAPPPVLAPYVDMSAYPPFDFVAASRATGHGTFCLGYVTSCGGVPAWAGVVAIDTLYLADHVRRLRLGGGDVVVSVGGPDGVDLAEDLREPADLAAAYSAVVDAYQVSWLEFAPCGPALAPDLVHVRNRAIAMLQRRKPRVTTSYALPAGLEGLTADAVGVLRSAAQHGVRVDVVTVLAHDLGAPNPAGSMGRYVRQALLNARPVVQEVLPGAAMGVCVTIGVNDVQAEVFDVRDARSLGAAVSELPWVRYVSFWSANRDHDDGRRDANRLSSGVRQARHAFLKEFAAALAEEPALEEPASREPASRKLSTTGDSPPAA